MSHNHYALCYKVTKKPNWTCKRGFKNVQEADDYYLQLKEKYQHLDTFIHVYNKQTPPIIEKLALTIDHSKIIIPTFRIEK